ncbi:iron ABC transporter permease [Streptomyces sp. NPDC005438]|uniref:ABC transporter permease n=1 Tax=Streptomyces sp. NPDC005438 TaxID=3156880 RepID=UPI0033B26371
MVVPLAFFGVFFAYPVLAIVARGLRPEGHWDLGRIPGIVTDPQVLDVLWFTTWQALVSTLVTLLVGLPGAYVFARFEFRGRRLLYALITVPFVLPTVVVGSAFLGLLGRGGLLDSWWGVRLDTSVWAIVLAHVFFNYAVVVRTVGGLWGALDPRQEEAARLLGASRFAAWRRLTLPALVPALSAASLMVFLFTFTSFGVIQILGGPRFATLEVEIYRQTSQLLALPTAAVLTLVQFAAVAGLLLLHAWTVRRRESALGLVSSTAARRRPRGAGDRAVLGFVLLVVLVLVLVPLSALIERSLHSSDGYGFRFYQALRSTDSGTFTVAPLEALGNSLLYAGVATVIALFVGGLAAAALTARAGRLVRGFDMLLMLPLGTSAVTVGFGFLIALDEPPLDLRSTWLIVPLAQALVGVPFVVRTVLPVLRAVQPRLREAAALLGASPFRVWREVDLPMARRALVVAASFAFAVSLGEFGATVFIARADNPTMPVAIARLLGRAGEINYGQAMALSTLLMALCALTLVLLDRLQTRHLGEF